MNWSKKLKRIGSCMRCKKFSFDLQPWVWPEIDIDIPAHCPDCARYMEGLRREDAIQRLRYELEDLCRDLRCFSIRMRLFHYCLDYCLEVSL